MGNETSRTPLTSSRPATRRDALKILSLAAASSLAAPAIVRAQGTQKYLKPIVAGLNAKQGDPSYESIAQIPAILREKYDVELTIQVHPSSVLGTDLSQLEAVQTGFIDITSNSTGQFAQFSKAFTFIDLPYAVTDWDMALRLFASDLWTEQAKKFEEATSLVVLPPVGAGGFRILWNNRRPTPTLSAAKGLKFRSTQSLADIELIKAWGGNPTPLAWTETYNGLKNGLVDGMHVQPLWTLNFNMYEVLKYGTEVGANFAIQLQVMNKNSLMSMPPVIRERFMQAASDAALEANTLDRRLEEESKKKLVERKLEIHKPSGAELAEWRAAGETVWKTDAAKGIGKAVFDRVVALR